MCNKSLTKQVCKYCNQNFYRGEFKLIIRGHGKVHVECYRKYLLEKYDKEYVNNKIEELINIEKEKNTKKKQKQIELKNKSDEKKKQRSDFINYIQETYDTCLDRNVFIKLTKINKGELQGLKEGISYEDLLYMFKSKQEMLTKIYQNNISKGKQFDNKGRFMYDLAILINKYDSYKKWKEQQQIVQAETNIKIEKEKNEIKIDYSKINNRKQQDNSNSDIDISDFIEDIY